MNQSLESSFEDLITAGSDNRLLVGEDGLNRYGCGPVPRNVTPLGSCTCSSPSPRGVDRAKRLLDRLRSAKSAVQEGELVCREHRSELRDLLALPEDVAIAFTPSGTDVELLALALVQLRARRRIVNVVVGPTEVGSGTPLAAAGCHYDDLVPSGARVTTGAPVCQSLAAQTSVHKVDIRDERGGILQEPVIDATVTELVSKAVEEGAHVLLHVVAHSKTGMHAPSLACVERITRNLPDDVSIVIDAAQGRISRQGLREVLKAGHLVILTGSKFYGGPAFAGALLVPERYQPTGLGATDVDFERCWPSGLEHYLTAAEMPEEWLAVRQRLSRSVNYGALLRWSAALAEMQAYYAVPSDARLAVLRAFETDVPDLFGDSDFIRLMPVFPPIYDPDQTRLLESKTTVFAFRVEINGRLLDRTELKRWHGRLNVCGDPESSVGDASGLGDFEFHLGQPVPFRDGSAALRIALGGELIVRVATDSRLGDTLEQRIDWLRRQLIALRRRLESMAQAAEAAAIA